jgi:hypothetical protein
MKPKSEELDNLAATLDKAIKETRNILGPDRIELISESEGSIGAMVAWPLLFRCLNLGESAMQAAKVRNGETVALTARSLAELCYLVGYMGPEFERVNKYIVGSTRDVRNKLKKVSEGAADPVIRKAASKMREMTADVPISLCEGWESQIAKRAEAANMGQDYLVRYTLLCEEAHHSERVLAHYMRKCSDGIEIRTRAEDRQIWLWLCLATFYWGHCVRPLLKYLRIAKASLIKKTLGPLEPWLELKEEKFVS